MELIAVSHAQMEDVERLLWEFVRTPPVKWRLPTWDDLGGGFWVVGLIGRQVIWYNDIEHGFNVSRYDQFGTIADYRCNQDELHHVIWLLGNQIQSRTLQGMFGPLAPTDAEPQTDDCPPSSRPSRLAWLKSLRRLVLFRSDASGDRR